jgi:NAD-dependent SIR2 family protein deacetylase
MSQTFRRSANWISRFSIVAIVLLAATALLAVMAIARSGYATGQRVVHEQPIQFSHAHHVGGMGIDCRYCHTSVEDSAFAGIPPTKTCMNCHSQIWNQAPFLEPVRASFQSGQPLKWTRVNDLPDFVYFNHSIHVNKGVGCATCHGPVDRMALVYQEAPLTMQWCLDCHRAPERFLRPRDQVFNMNYQPPADQLELGRRLVKEHKVASVEQLISCSTCHR